MCQRDIKKLFYKRNTTQKVGEFDPEKNDLP